MLLPPLCQCPSMIINNQPCRIPGFFAGTEVAHGHVKLWQGEVEKKDDDDYVLL